MSSFLNLPLLIAQAGDQAATTSDDAMTLGIKFGIAVLVLVASFGLGILIARAVKMPDYSLKIGVALFTIIASVTICIVGWPPKLGIDLSGGVVLIYEVEHQDSADSDLAQMNTKLNEDQAIKIAATRMENGKIRIVVPKELTVDDVKARVAKAADAGAAPALSNEFKDGDTQVLVYSADRFRPAVDMAKLVAAINKRINPSGVKEVTVRQYGAEQLEVIVPEVDPREVELIKRLISTAGALEFRILAANISQDREIIAVAQRTKGREVLIGDKPKARWVKLGKDVGAQGAIVRDSPRGTEVLVILDPFDVEGRYIQHSSTDRDETGRPCVRFSFYTEGANLFGGLTGSHLPDPSSGFEYRLGIILDGELLSAPNIKSQIRGEGQITGSFTQEEVDFIVGVLNAGSLPATLQKVPISQSQISAQLGSDTIKSGARAMFISTLCVLAFMLIYYRFAGMVANIAVLINLVATVALMILIHAAFTLPGLAGMVLTVGMAVDANVLVYERMREEAARGASMRMVIRNGYERAMSTIIDSNMTTMLTALVLYIIGTDQIKGFAVTLILGLMVSLYTAIFISRMIFDIAEKNRWYTRVNMMRMIGETHFDFVKLMRPAAIASVTLIAIGLFAAGVRGKGLLDIDFTGGSSVHVMFKDPQTDDFVRETIATLPEGKLPDVAVSSVGTAGRQYKIDTSNKEIAEVEGSLKEVFGQKLATYGLSFGDMKVIEAAAKPAEKPATDSAKAGDSKGAKATPDAKKLPATGDPSVPAKTEDKPATPESPATEDTSTPEAKKDTPEATQDAAEPAPDATEPKPGDGARRSRSSSAPLALAGHRSLVLAALALGQVEADKPAVKDPAKTDDAVADDAEKSADAVQAPAEADKAAAAPPADETPADATVEAAPAQTPTSPAAAGKPDETKSGTAKAGPAKEDSPADDEAEDAFVGGTSVDLKFDEPINEDTLREIISSQLALSNPGTVQANLPHFEVTNPKLQPGSSLAFSEWNLRIQLPADQVSPLLDGLKKTLNDSPVFPSADQIGGKVAGDTREMAVYAILISWLMIILYVWFRFQNLLFGLAAVLALVHDVLMTVGFLALSYWLADYLGFLQVDQFKINLSVVAALLTIIGFSINDTIVIFDRIREIRGKSKQLTADMINLAVNQTLGRSILTSGTVLIACAILYFFGGQGIHSFAYAMLVGVIAGSYSTIYIAAPVLLWMKQSPDAGVGNGRQQPAKSGAR